MASKPSETTVQSLIGELADASRLYYLDGEDSPLSDAEFDAKQNYLLSIRDDFPHLFADGTPGHSVLDGDPLLGATQDVAADATITHAVPMLSLAKAKTEEELESRIRRIREAGATSFHLQAKIDGSAVTAIYRDGVLTTLASRGDGVHGENLTYLLSAPLLTIEGLADTIDHTGTLEVRGEMFFTNAQFEAADAARVALGGEHFENPRNAAAGLIKKAASGLPHPVELTFAAYSTVDNGTFGGTETLDGVPGFLTVDALAADEAPHIPLLGLTEDRAIHDSIDAFGLVRSTLTFPTDGIVLKPTNEAQMHSTMGATSHHPSSQVAWKYPAAQGSTTITAIHLTIGKTGRVTPVATFEPVKLDGSTISQASLHNFNLVAEKDVRVGSTVLVEKANEIIPQVVAVVSNPADSVPLEVPSTCPACATTLEHSGDVWPPKTLTCPNANCPSRDFFALKAAVGRTYLDIDRLSEATLSSLHESGKVNSVADLYHLTLDDLATSELGTTSTGNIRLLGEKTAQHILDHIDRSRTLPLERILPSLSIPTLGRRAAKLLVAHFPTLDAILGATLEELEAIPGFGTIKAQSAYQGLRDRRAVLDSMRDGGVTFGENGTTANTDGDSTDTPSTTAGPDLSGLAFSISGPVPAPFPNRDALVDHIEAHGGTFHSSPRRGTTHMIADPTGTSSKVTKARDLGVTFIDAATFTQDYT